MFLDKGSVAAIGFEWNKVEQSGLVFIIWWCLWPPGGEIHLGNHMGGKVAQG